MSPSVFGVIVCENTTSRCIQVPCESVIKRKSQKIRYEMCKKLLNRFQKMHTVDSHLPMKRFSISRRNSIAKMTVYMPKVVMRPKTKFQGIRVVYTLIGNGLVGNFVYSETQIYFLNASIKTNVEVYRAMLSDALPPLEKTVFIDKDR